MIESPLLKEILDERDADTRRQDIKEVLTERFQAVGPEVTDALQGVVDLIRLQELLRWAVRCPDLDSFRSRL